MSLSSFSLEGKKALVVGARRNMGKGFALGLAEAGADVAISDVNMESGQLQAVADEIQQMGRKSLAIKADISNQKEVKKLVQSVVKEFGTIDILMNVAVMYHPKSVIDLDEESWDKLTDINLKGYWLMIQEVSPIMMKQKSGSIINLTSRGGLKAHADKMMGNYAIVKSGIAMMTRQYCRYLGPHNVRVNAIAPSVILSERVKKLLKNSPEIEAISKTHLLGLGEPIHVADLAVYLAADESAITTGQVISVDSGVTIV